MIFLLLEGEKIVINILYIVMLIKKRSSLKEKVLGE